MGVIDSAANALPCSTRQRNTGAVPVHCACRNSYVILAVVDCMTGSPRWLIGPIVAASSSVFVNGILTHSGVAIEFQ